MGRHGLQILFVFFLTLITWHKVLFQSFMGEGFYYFAHGFSYSSFSVWLTEFVTSYESGAKLFYDIFSKIFREHIVFYQIFLLLAVSTINSLYYLLIIELTKEKFIAIVASILFTVNFVGFEMFAIGNYQFFSQRTLSLLFLFPSLIFLIHFLRSKSNKALWYSLSIIFYSLSFLLFHFSLFFAPFFFSVLMIYGKGFRKKMKDFFLGVIFLSPFLFIPSFLLFHGKAAAFFDGNNLFSFYRLFGSKIPNAMMQQLVYATIPDGIMRSLAHTYSLSHVAMAQSLFRPVILLYGVATFFIFRVFQKKKSNLTRTAVWSLFFFVLVFFLNLYIRWEMTNNIGGGSRYLYIPMTAVSLFWSIFLYAFFVSKILSHRTIILMLSIWCLSNISSIWTDIQKDMSQHKTSFLVIDFVKKISPTFETDSVIIVPNVMGYHGAGFLQKFFGKSQTSFAPMFSDWGREIPRPFDPSKDYILVYEEELKAVKDMTHNYKSIIKQKFPEIEWYE